MASKTVYHMSARQIVLLAFAAAIIAVGATALVYSLTTFLREKDQSGVSFAEAAPPGINDPNTVSDEQNSIEVYRTIAPGVAFINTTSIRQDWWGGTQEGKGNGSGSVIDNEGHILTNYHVIEGAQRVSVNFGGDKVYPATLVGGDPDTDLAVIKIEPPQTGLTVIPLGNSDALAVGQKVLAIGNPFGLDRTLTTGVISGLQRPIRARNNRLIDAAIQTDASINPGNSGGPLLDKFGKMIGINSQILAPAGGSVGVGFAVPVNTAKRVIPQLIQYGEVRRPKLGSELRSVKDIQARFPNLRLPVASGLIVLRVVPGGAAERAGLQGLTDDGTIGDIVTAADGQELNDMDDLFRMLDKAQFGQTVQLTVNRAGRTVTVPIRFAAPSSPTRPTPQRRPVQDE